MKPDNKGSITKELRAELQRAVAQELGFLVLGGTHELVERDEHAAQPPEINDDATVDGVVAAAVQIAHERAAKLAALRQCLQAKNNKVALQLAAELCGLREARHEASDSASSRKH